MDDRNRRFRRDSTDSPHHIVIENEVADNED
jgi:hypothetical protein